jgi:hypothetical protein
MCVHHYFYHEWFDDQPFINGFYAVDNEPLKPKVGMVFDSLIDVERF